MAENKYDLIVAYRIYPKVSKIPPVFYNDKFKLAELCLSSFKESLGNLKVKLWVLLDNCPPSYDELFKKYFDESDLELIHLSGVGNSETFKKQLEILSNQYDSEYVYFAEDDYFYLPGQFREMLHLLEKYPEVDFIAPYDHLDYYEFPLHKYQSRIIHSGKKHWRSVATACMTFLTTKTALNKTKKVFLTYSRGNYDASVWLSLTKHRIKSPFRFMKYLFKDMEIVKIFFKAWYFCGFRIVFGKKMSLYVPIPSISTHMDNKSLAPCVDWLAYFNEMKEKINFL